VIDLHTHLLPGVDDGSPSLDVSLPVLERFGAEGVELLVCTPHLDASRAAEAPIARNAEIFARLVASAPARPALLLGWEIMLDVPGADLRAPHLRLGGSRAVLVEFPRTNVPRQGTAELARLRSQGLVPVLAHPERYWGCTAAQVAEWRRAGAVIQTDATMLLGQTPMGRLARELLEDGLVDCLASDNHGDYRSLAAVRRWLEELGAHEQARVLTHGNPARLLADEPTLPVAPIPPARGMMRRLRELMLGRSRGG
jgi:protein-tyrosine phosphatase